MLEVRLFCSSSAQRDSYRSAVVIDPPSLPRYLYVQYVCALGPLYLRFRAENGHVLNLSLIHI